MPEIIEPEKGIGQMNGHRNPIVATPKDNTVMVRVLKEIVAQMEADTWSPQNGAALIFRGVHGTITLCDYLHGEIDPERTVFKKAAEVLGYVERRTDGPA